MQTDFFNPKIILVRNREKNTNLSKPPINLPISLLLSSPIQYAAFDPINKYNKPPINKSINLFTRLPIGNVMPGEPSLPPHPHASVYWPRHIVRATYVFDPSGWIQIPPPQKRIEPFVGIISTPNRRPGMRHGHFFSFCPWFTRNTAAHYRCNV